MGVLTGLSADAISQLSAAKLKTLTPADIAGMTAAQLPGLTASQMALLSTGQLLSFTKAQIPSLTPAAIDGLAPKQIALMLPTQVAAMTTAQLSSLGTAQVAALNVAGVLSLTPAQVSALTAAGLAALTTGQFSVLSAADIAALAPAQIAGLTTGEIAALNATQLKALTGAQLGSLTPAQLGKLSPSQIASLAPTALTGLSGSQIAALTTAQFAGLTAADIAALTPAQVASFSAGEVAGLNPAQVKALTAPQLAALTADEISHLSAAQIASITPAAIAGFTQDQVSDLTTAQRAGLTPAQIKALGSLLNPATPTTPTITPPAPTPPAPTPPAPTPPAPTPPAPTPTPPTVTPPDPTPPAPTVTTPTTTTPPTVTPPDPTPPTTTPPVTTAPATPGFTPAQLSAMTGAQIAALTADQINALGADQLAALNLDYNKMLAILQTDANGGMNAGEFGALQALAGKLNVSGGITVSNYLQQITDNVILGNAANATWTGGAAKSVALGNLSASSTETQVDELIGKWFLGTDTPASKVNITGAPNYTVTEKKVSLPLYGAAGPNMADINQGDLGDCFFLAPLAEVAAMDPSAIQSMITDNGNGSYGVAFSVNGKADFVTVDTELANGGTIFNHGADDWASLVEKAYAQLQAGGNVTGNSSGLGNSYSNLANGGSPESALEAVTGAAAIMDYVADGASWKSYTFDGPSLTVPNNPKASSVTASSSGIADADLLTALTADLAAGDYLILSSNSDAVDAAGKSTLMSDHAYAMYGFDSGTSMFNLYNPWGTASSGAQPWDTTFEVGLDKLLAAGDVISVALSSPAGSPITASKPNLLQPASAIGAAPALLGLAVA
jgi:hypothetical protein